MENSQETPSVIRIIWTDYYAFFSALLPICIWSVVLFLWNGRFFLEIGVPGTVFISGLLAWRVLLFRKVFRQGKSVMGRISTAYLARDRGRVEYTYSYQGKFYQSGTWIHRNNRTKALKTGETVILVVDDNNPRRAFIRALYLDQASK